jgi:peptidoglycan/LPS O-acetylase OafA/YrhL
LWLAYVIHLKFAKLSSLLIAVGSHSFGIYLIHPMLLSTFRYYIKSTGGSLHYTLYFIASFFVTIVGAYYLTVLIKKYVRHYWIWIGK